MRDPFFKRLETLDPGDLGELKRLARYQPVPRAGASVKDALFPPDARIALRASSDEPTGKILESKPGILGHSIELTVAVPPPPSPDLEGPYQDGLLAWVRSPAKPVPFTRAVLEALDAKARGLVDKALQDPEGARPVLDELESFRSQHAALFPRVPKSHPRVFRWMGGSSQDLLWYVEGLRFADDLSTPTVVIASREGEDDSYALRLANLLDVPVSARLHEAEFLAIKRDAEPADESLIQELVALHEAAAQKEPRTAARAGELLRGLEAVIQVVAVPLAPETVTPGDVFTVDVVLGRDPAPPVLTLPPVRLGGLRARGRTALFTCTPPEEAWILLERHDGFRPCLAEALIATELDFEAALDRVLEAHTWAVPNDAPDVARALEVLARRRGISFPLGPDDELLERGRLDRGALKVLAKFDEAPEGQLLAFTRRRGQLRVLVSRGPKPADLPALCRVPRRAVQSLWGAALLRGSDSPAGAEARALAWIGSHVPPDVLGEALKANGCEARSLRARTAAEFIAFDQEFFDVVWSLDPAIVREERPAYLLGGKVLQKGLATLSSDRLSLRMEAFLVLAPGAAPDLKRLQARLGLQRDRRSEEDALVSRTPDSLSRFIELLDPAVTRETSTFPMDWREACMALLLGRLPEETGERLTSACEAVDTLLVSGVRTRPEGLQALARRVAREASCLTPPLLETLLRVSRSLPGLRLEKEGEEIARAWEGPPSAGLVELLGLWAGFTFTSSAPHYRVHRVGDPKASEVCRTVLRAGWVRDGGVIVRGILEERRPGSPIATISWGVAGFLRDWEDGDKEAAAQLKSMGLALPENIPPLGSLRPFARARLELEGVGEALPEGPIQACFVRAIHATLQGLADLIVKTYELGNDISTLQRIHDTLVPHLISQASRHLKIELGMDSLPTCGSRISGRGKTEHLHLRPADRPRAGSLAALRELPFIWSKGEEEPVTEGRFIEVAFAVRT